MLHSSCNLPFPLIAYHFLIHSFSVHPTAMGIRLSSQPHLYNKYNQVSLMIMSSENLASVPSTLGHLCNSQAESPDSSIYSKVLVVVYLSQINWLQMSGITFVN